MPFGHMVESELMMWESCAMVDCIVCCDAVLQSELQSDGLLLSNVEVVVL